MRADGNGGSRIVSCPTCKVLPGQPCRDSLGLARRNGHPKRVGAAYALVEKRNRKTRLSLEGTRGIRAILALVERHAWISGLGSSHEYANGVRLARDAAIAAVQSLLRKRGAQ